MRSIRVSILRRTRFASAWVEGLTSWISAVVEGIAILIVSCGRAFKNSKVRFVLHSLRRQRRYSKIGGPWLIRYLCNVQLGASKSFPSGSELQEWGIGGGQPAWHLEFGFQHVIVLECFHGEVRGPLNCCLSRCLSVLSLKFIYNRVYYQPPLKPRHWLLLPCLQDGISFAI